MRSGKVRAFGFSNVPSWYAAKAQMTAAEAVAAEIGRPVAQVALNWVMQQPGVASTIIGARGTDQLEQNLAALEFELTDQQMSRLDEASDSATEKLHLMWRPQIQRQFMTPGYTVTREPETYRPRTAA